MVEPQNSKLEHEMKDSKSTQKLEVIEVDLMADEIIKLEEQKAYEIQQVIENAASLTADQIIEMVTEIGEKYKY